MWLFGKHKWRTDFDKSRNSAHTYQECQKTGKRRVITRKQGYQPIDHDWLQHREKYKPEDKMGTPPSHW